MIAFRVFITSEDNNPAIFADFGSAVAWALACCQLLSSNCYVSAEFMDGHRDLCAAALYWKPGITFDVAD